MPDAIHQLLQFGSIEGTAELALYFVVYLLAGLVPACAIVFVIYVLVTLPIRRKERARLVLDLLELGLKEGRAPEAALIDAAASRDRSFGARFHLLAAHLEKGLRLSSALARVPRLLAPEINGMLKVGEEIGDIKKVLPACRQLLNDSVSHVRGALNYLLVLGFAVTPAALFIPIILRIKVLPAYKQVFEGMLEGASMPALSRWVFGESDLMTAVQLATFCFIWLAILAYLGGPGLRAGLGEVWPGFVDKIFLHLPWRRKRLQRDFSAMLAVLLDTGVAEPEAVSLAAESTANWEIVRRAETVRARLKEGIKLPQAIRAIDDSNELQWRLSNALARGGDFLRALSGWHEALDAKAFQLEQSAAQITTTALVLLNGLLIGLLVTAIFLVLIQLINRAVLW